MMPTNARAASGNDRQEQEGGKHHEMHRAVQHGGATAGQRDGADGEGENQQDDFLWRQAESHRHLEHDGDEADRRDRQADGGQRRTQREVEADLHPVADRGAEGGAGFGQQDDQRDDDADEGAGRADCLDHRLDAGRQGLGKPDHGNQRGAEQHECGHRRVPGGSLAVFVAAFARGADGQEMLAVTNCLDEDVDAEQQQ